MTIALKVESLTASVDDKQILHELDLEISFGEVHAIMGPNGSGKSTLCHVLAGKSGYEVSGSAHLDGRELLSLDVDERSRAGILLSFQYPTQVPGVRLDEFMLEAADERGIDAAEARERVARQSKRFDVEPFLERSLNDELSGGEQKRSEIFQMAVLEPKVALLDEIDSGLDIDAVKQVAEAVEEMRSPDLAVLIITHYSRILRYMTPDRIHVMIDGQIVDSGGSELAEELEEGGYDSVRKRLGISAATEEPAIKPADFFTETPFDL
ncbi:MAG: Fe-S cluster assembly ATPase SufC [Acidimicrobiia bacterium]|nr:Fe-S cluster assembly ATPase SufC [Acidimicrobiia bacterium]